MNFSVNIPFVCLMKKGVIVSAFSCLLFIGSLETNGQAAKTYRANGKTITIKDFNKEIEKILSEVGVPGLSLAVIDKNQVVFSKNYGYKSLTDKEKVNDETIFEAASLSKSFLLLIAYKLVDEGKLDLDKPLFQYLKNDRLEYDSLYKLITGRMVLSHSSGLENWQANHNPDTLELLSNPGEEYHYSGEGYNYLAEAIEVILGDSIYKYMEDRVYKPLQLKRTYSCFKDGGKFPENHAYGHDEFGAIEEKTKYLSPVPSSGINTTAHDYAKLIVALFDNKHISKNRVKDILKPIVSIGGSNPNLFHGPGFEILFTANDTIIFQGGSNSGWKGQLCYSTVNKKGIVIMTNGDRGKLMTQKISEMTVGLDLAPYFKGDVFSQYPSVPCNLFNVYREKGTDEMFAGLTKMISENKKAINEDALNELAYLFREKDSEIAKRLAQENIILFPQSPNSYWILGKLYYGAEQYKLAHENLVKAKTLNFQDQDWIDYDIKKLEKIISQLPN